MNLCRAGKLAVAVGALFCAEVRGADGPRVTVALVSAQTKTPSAQAKTGDADPAKQSDEPKAEAAPLKKLTIRALDAEGSPVSGAHVGLGAHFGGAEEPKKPSDRDADGFVYEWHCLTNSRGVAELEAGGADLRPLLGERGIFVREDKRHLAAVVHLDAAKAKDKLDVSLLPECYITGKVLSPQLKKDEKPLGMTTVSLGDGDRVTLTYTSEGTGDYHFFVPPGDYLLDAGGSNIVRVFATIEVPNKEHDLVFEPMTAAPSKLALLEGQPAPELRGAVAWKNGPPQTIAGQKGKCVLLFFWRATSPASLEAVPAVVDLYDKLKMQGLVVLGVQVDVDADKKPIDSAQKLDDAIAKVRQESWGGHDIPFPVAIVPPSPTPWGDKTDPTQWGDSPAAADYGVTQYPTVLLIDRHGVLVSELVDSDQSLALLAKTLGLRPAVAASAPPKPSGTSPKTPATPPKAPDPAAKPAQTPSRSP
jgi:hypothetical protein